MFELVNLFCISKLFFNNFLCFYIVRKYEISLPEDSIHKDKLQLEPDNTGTMGPYPIPLIFKRNTD